MANRHPNGNKREPITRVQFASIQSAREFYRRVRLGYGHRVAAVIAGACMHSVWAL
jgi:hypothetical protein